MNGQWLGSRPIRTNWAIRKPALANSKDGKPFETVHRKVVNKCIQQAASLLRTESKLNASTGKHLTGSPNQKRRPVGVLHDA